MSSAPFPESGRRGLAGRTVVVTRDEGPDGPLSQRLRSLGAIALRRGTVGFRFEGPGSELDEAARGLAEFEWILLTSARAARALGEIGALRRRKPPGIQVAVVGPGTANAIGSWGWRAEIVPDSGGATALLQILESRIKRGDRVFFPASSATSDELADALRDRGAYVLQVVAYGPVAVEQDPAVWDADLARNRLDALTLTSPSALEALTALPSTTLRGLRTIPAAVQGPTTAAAVREAGWSTVIEADPTTFDGLVSSLSDHFDR